MEQVEGDDADLLSAWRQGRAERRDLYIAVRKAMYQAARQGIGAITSSDPDDQAVEDVVYDAFIELEAKDPATVTSVLGLAKRIAFQRGRDRGRKIVREREKMRDMLHDLVVTDDPQFREEDIRAAVAQEKLVSRALVCLERLNGDQRGIVEDTIMGRENLSDWAVRKGKSHQSASRQRGRALEALRRCVSSTTASRAEEGSGGQH